MQENVTKKFYFQDYCVTEPTVFHRPVCPGEQGVSVQKKEDAEKGLRLNPRLEQTEQRGTQGLYRVRLRAPACACVRAQVRT